MPTFRKVALTITVRVPVEEIEVVYCCDMLDCCDRVGFAAAAARDVLRRMFAISRFSDHTGTCDRLIDESLPAVSVGEEEEEEVAAPGRIENRH